MLFGNLPRVGDKYSTSCLSYCNSSSFSKLTKNLLAVLVLLNLLSKQGRQGRFLWRGISLVSTVGIAGERSVILTPNRSCLLDCDQQVYCCSMVGPLHRLFVSDQDRFFGLLDGKYSSS